MAYVQPRLTFRKPALAKATLTVCLIATSFGIHADQTNSSSILQQQQQQGLPSALHLLPTAEPELLTELPAAVGNAVNVQQVIFSGDQSQISPFELQALVSDAIGSELDLPGLQALSHRVTDHFKAQGWILTRAYLPQQDVTEGIITIAIMPGIVSTSNPVNVLSLIHI